MIHDEYDKKGKQTQHQITVESDIRRINSKNVVLKTGCNTVLWESNASLQDPKDNPKTKGMNNSILTHFQVTPGTE